MSHKNQTNSYTEFFYKAFRNTLIIGIPLVIISAIVLSSLRISATGSGSGTDSLTISISSACTLSSTVDTEHNASINAGTYKDNIGKTTIKTTCNDNNGYSIYANGYSNNEEGNNRLINTLSPSNAIETGLNTSGDISSWAMKLNNIPDDPSPTPPVIESAYDDTYGLIPSSWTKVLSLSSGSTDMSLGSSFTTTYAVYANSRQYTGTYQGQVKYLLTHPNNTAEILFMQNIAEWKDAILRNEGDSIQATDQRDGKKYWVTKLKDGNVWMTQNLDLDLDPAKPLTSNDTDLTDHSLTGAYADGYNYDVNTGVTTWTPNSKTIYFSGGSLGWNSNAEPRSANKTDDMGTGHTSLGNYYSWTAAIASNNSTSISTKYTVANNSICPKGWRLPIATSADQSIFEFGRLLYEQSITTIMVNPNNIENSVPYTNDGFNNIRKDPLWFVQSGDISNGSLSDYQSDGYYWSSTVFNGSAAYRLSFDDSGVWPANYYGYRSNGRPIRCITE